MKTAWVTFNAINMESAASLEKLLHELAQNSKDEQGMVRYEVFRAQDNVLSYYVRESWEDEAAMQQHLAQPHLARFSAAANKLLRAPFALEKIETLLSF